LFSWALLRNFKLRKRPTANGLGAIQILELRTLLTTDLGNLPALTQSFPSEDQDSQNTGSSGDNGDGTPTAPDVPENYRIGFPDTIQIGQLSVPISVTVLAAASNTSLDGWIDWNGDGNWGGAQERVYSHVAIVVGDNLLRVDVPAWARPGLVTARFQVNIAGDEGNSDGVGNSPGSTHKLPDCQLMLVPPNYPSGVFGPPNPINTSAAGAFTVDAADIDHDGDLDILSASSNDNTIAWYENDGQQKFTEHTITTSAMNATWVVSVDLDRDGDLDVIASSLDGNSITWYENDGTQKFKPHLITVTENEIDAFVVADLDGDGDTDIVASSKANDSVTWYENGGQQVFTKHLVTTTANLACSVYVADMDGDGYLDIVSASFFDDTIAWYENDGGQAFTKRIVTANADGAREVIAADIDGDGDQDIVSTSFYDNTIGWYENDGNGNFTRHIVNSTAKNVIAVFAADMDGDGDLDILAAMRGSNTVAWFENTGTFSFPQHTISTTDLGAHGIIAADVNGDGRLDVVSASQFGGRIAWYENLTNSTPLTVSIDSKTPAVTAQTVIPVTITFNGPVSGLTADNLIVENATIEDFAGSGASYSFNLIPITEGRASVALPAGIATGTRGYSNPEASLYRQFDSVLPQLTVSGSGATFVWRQQPIKVAPALSVVGSRLGGGTLVVAIDSMNTSKVKADVFDDSTLGVLGTLTRKLTGGKHVTSVTLSPTVTAADIEMALRAMTFQTSKLGPKPRTRQLRVQLTDVAGQSAVMPRQTIQIVKTPVTPR
jgi:hypothetical protein